MRIGSTLKLAPFIFFFLGCHTYEPTSIATVDNSGRELIGTFKLGQEVAPFARCSIHIGYDRFTGGEIAELQLTDLWTGEEHFISGTVPTRPANLSLNTLILSINKDFSLNASWKDDSLLLEDKHSNYFSENFKVLPIVIQNEGPRRDFVTRILQGQYAYLCRRANIPDSNRFINYGFIHIGDDSFGGTLLMSYGPGIFTETRYIKLPTEITKDQENVSAIYIHTDQSKDKARVYLLTQTPSNPREVAFAILSKAFVPPEISVELDIFKTNTHIMRDNFSIPDPSTLR